MTKIFLPLLILLIVGCSTKNESNNSDIHVTKTSEGKIIRVAPKFPKKALRNKVYSGAVLLGFDIDEQGKTNNIKVIDSKPKKIFDKSAIKALSQWSYPPKIIAGKAIKQSNLTVTLNFGASPKK